eukprot:366171-Chlamydomonas_euryale.AAC.3
MGFYDGTARRGEEHGQPFQAGERMGAPPPLGCRQTGERMRALLLWVAGSRARTVAARVLCLFYSSFGEGRRAEFGC